MTAIGTFYGIGVGPGEQGLLPVLAWERLQHCQVIYVPRATSKEVSTARGCLPTNTLPEERFVEIEFDMSRDHAVLLARYTAMADSIAAHLRAGRDVAYLTLGDTMTYSTFNYTLQAVRKSCPEALWRVFPGISSYAALAAATGFSLGEGKERVQILPCPETPDELEFFIRCNDIVVLMKVGKRLPMVLKVLQKLGLVHDSAFGSRIGMPDGVCFQDLTPLLEAPHSGYLSTMLIRNPDPKFS
jgi:precorrin-2/cobalt-factor-2 C20-methyltransferase